MSGHPNNSAARHAMCVASVPKKAIDRFSGRAAGCPCAGDRNRRHNAVTLAATYRKRKQASSPPRLRRTPMACQPRLAGCCLDPTCAWLNSPRMGLLGHLLPTPSLQEPQTTPPPDATAMASASPKRSSMATPADEETPPELWSVSPTPQRHRSPHSQCELAQRISWFLRSIRLVAFRDVPPSPETDDWAPAWDDPGDDECGNPWSGPDVEGTDVTTTTPEPVQ